VKNTTCDTCACTHFSKSICQPDCQHNYDYVYTLSPKKCSNRFKEIFSHFYDVLVLDMFLCVPLRAQVPDTALVSGRGEWVNPKHVERNFFLLKLVILVEISYINHHQLNFFTRLYLLLGIRGVLHTNIYDNGFVTIPCSSFILYHVEVRENLWNGINLIIDWRTGLKISTFLFGVEDGGNRFFRNDGNQPRTTEGLLFDPRQR
jgi:hypothetical protein